MSTSSVIYFDNNATTRLASSVLVKMNEAYSLPLNSSAIHQLGRKGASLVEEARKNLCNLLNAQNYQVIFTGSATEATNMLLFGCDAKIIFISQIEHAAVAACHPQDKKIVEIATLPNGIVDISDLEKKLEQLEDKNFLVSVMLANNETGAIQPIEEIAKLTHQKGGLMHSDIVQAVGKIDVDLERLNIDFASVSAHKINGPQGVGAFLLRKGLDIKPLIYGGKQERSKRAGTVNVAGIVGFGEACKLSKEKIANYAKVKELRDLLELKIKKIAAEVGEDKVKIFADDVARLPNTSLVAIKNSDNQTQLINFDLNGICVSSGSACSSGSSSGSKVLKAMNVDSSFADSAIRISLDLENSEEEVTKFIEVWASFFRKRYKK